MGKLIFKMFKTRIAITGKIFQHSITYYPIFVIIAMGILFGNWNAQAQARVINLRALHNLSVSDPIPPWLINKSIQKVMPDDTVVCDSLVVEGNLHFLKKVDISVINQT